MYDAINLLSSSNIPADNDLVLIGDASQVDGAQVRGMDWSVFLGNLEVDRMNSGSASNNQVPTSDGLGGIEWEDPTGGFNLHDDVDAVINAGNLAVNDRMLVSDESVANDPNRFVTVGTVIEVLYDVGSTDSLTNAPEDGDFIFIGDLSRAAGNRIRSTTYGAFVEDLEVDRMSSGSASNNQVPRADGSGGIDWENIPAGGNFNLHDDVTLPIGTLQNIDRILVADEGTVGDPNRYITFEDFTSNLLVDGMSSGTAASGRVPTADGLGAITWEAPGAAAGGFDLYDDVPFDNNDDIGLADRLVLSATFSSNVNSWANLDNVLDKLHSKCLRDSASSTIEFGNTNDFIIVGDGSRADGGKIRGRRLESFLGDLTVEHMNSGTATNGQVPTADGAGAITWEDGGSGGGSGTEDPDFFLAPIEERASYNITVSPVNALQLTAANAVVNRGGFTVETYNIASEALQVPAAGTYSIDFSLYVVSTVGVTRNSMVAALEVSRSGTDVDSLRTDFSSYYRNDPVTDELYLSGSVTLPLEAGDQIRIGIYEFAGTSSTYTTGGQQSKLSVVRIGAISGAGQQSPQSQGSNAPNGLVRERVYQAISSGAGLPLDPPDIWNTTTAEFEDDFSPWSRTQPTLTGTQILVVADGFSILDDQDVRQNGAWSKYFSLTEQYCSIIQDNSTYTLDSTVAGLRFVRSLLSTGWGAWKPLEDANDGWVEILSQFGTHSSNANNIDGSFITPIDCTFFSEIEFDFWTHGNSDGTNPGGRSQYRYRRTEGNWSGRLEGTLSHTSLGSFKLFYYDEFGLNGSAALSGSFNDDFVGNINAGTGNPVRRYSFLFHLNIESVLTPNLISGYQIGPFSGANQYSSMIVRMR